MTSVLQWKEMSTLQRRASVVAAFGLFLILLCVNSWITWHELRVQMADEAWTLHTRQVLLELSRTESLISDAETGQRGFLYTGDPKYLAPYNQAIQQVQPELDALAQLTGDNPVQQNRVSNLRRLATDKFEEMGQTLVLFRAGEPDAARALVLSGHGLELMAQIRERIAEMRSEEVRLSDIRSSTYERSTRVTLASIWLTTAAAGVGLVCLAFYILRDIRFREEHAQYLEEREKWFRSTLTSLGDAVIATDAEGRVTFVNPIAEKILGEISQDLYGKILDDVFRICNEVTGKPVENPVKRVIESGHVVGLANHTVLQRSDGSLVPIEDSAAPICDAEGRIVGVVLVFRDATAERKSQELMRKTEKLSAAARIAATVAHEINNPLEAMGNLIFLARNAEGLPAGAASYLEMAAQELDRVSHITRQTLGFYRESAVAGPIDLRTVVESVLTIHANKFKVKSIRLEKEFDNCPPVVGLSGELKQLAANLISNAADAVAEGGRIRVSLGCGEAAIGRIAVLRVEDDGPGIDPKNIEQIFEPFFTTKKDVGTGLGLWVSREIASRHGGSIELESNPNGSFPRTTFKVTLPAGESSVAATAENVLS